jgi:hypothetical protein
VFGNLEKKKEKDSFLSSPSSLFLAWWPIQPAGLLPSLLLVGLLHLRRPKWHRRSLAPSPLPHPGRVGLGPAQQGSCRPRHLFFLLPESLPAWLHSSASLSLLPHRDRAGLCFHRRKLISIPWDTTRFPH